MPHVLELLYRLQISWKKSILPNVYNQSNSRSKTMLNATLLDAEKIYEFVFDRYIDLEARADHLAQDLGIASRREATVEIEIRPDSSFHEKSNDIYYLNIEQSLTSLNSSKDNNNSTTGYVLWTTSIFMAKWLLYNKNARILIKGGTLPNLKIDSMFQRKQDARKRCIVELGTGISPMFPVIFSNYVDKYVATDQRGILSKLRHNIEENQSECNKRVLKSSTLQLSGLLHRTEEECNLDVTDLDWELFKPTGKHASTTLNCPEGSHVTLLAMDVVYNDFLIKPFLQTLDELYNWYESQKCTVSSIIGIQLRAQDVVEKFIEDAVIEKGFKVYNLDDEELSQSRYILLYILK